jgi:acyl carrier protein
MRCLARTPERSAARACVERVTVDTIERETQAMSGIRAQVRDFIEDNFLMGARAARLGDAESFLERRILDSTGFLELITFLEQTYGIAVADDEMVPEYLDSLVNVEAFVQRKRAAAPETGR